MVEKKTSFYSNCMKRLSPRIKEHVYIGFDVETTGKTNKFYSGGLYWIDRNKERFEYFTDKEKMAEFMLTRKFRNKYIVATNLGFDFTVVFYNTKYWNKFKLLMRNGNIIQASYNLGNNNGRIRFIDTSNYVMFSVEKLGKIIGVNKLDKPSFLGKKPKTIEQKIELMNYNRMDCKVTHDFMNFFQRGVNEVGGTVKLTIASTSMHTWRMRFQPQDLIKEEYMTGDENIRDFIFSGYYGGRTEVFKRGTFENIHYYDVNSLYPYVMRNRFPLPQSVRKVPKWDVSIANIQDYEGVTECFVYCPPMDKPLLPLRMNDRLCFPTGRFRGTWNNVELRKALELGYILTPVKQIIYTKTFDPFTEFVDTFYETRMKYLKEGNPFEIVVKLMMNSLYGKFGMKKTETFNIIDMKEFATDHRKFMRLTDDKEFDIKDGKLIIREEKPFNGIYSFPILASYVTSYARLHMYDFINKETVIYTDTDSVITTSELTGCDKTLGNIKDEGTYKRGIFVKPKFYLIDEYVKIKGVNKACMDDFNAIMQGKPVTKKKFSRMKESARRGIIPNTIIEVTKRLTLEDEKRVWEHNDITRPSMSKPIEVELWS